jgi:hypothetical protein
MDRQAPSAKKSTFIEASDTVSEHYKEAAEGLAR